MAYGVLGLTPREFGEMTLNEFYARVQGFGWSRELQAKARAQIIAAIANYSGNLRRGQRVRVESLCPPRKNPPKNMFYRQLMGLPW
jgi:hypothetical protein